MSIDTKKVEGRRELNYSSIQDVVADAERLSSGSVKTLGNWSPGQVYQHLANAYNGSIDGFPNAFPWLMKAMARVFKKKLTAGPMPAGLKLPAVFAKVVMPAPTSLEVGLAALRAAVSRLEQEPHRADHPIFGKISNEEWNNLHVKHANLHMSFLVRQ
jgi:uncharacterized protein DUF1569